ncbi:MAG: DUF3459 domain-containing protein, partial [Methylobacteriaceae bacterium]|nr:DUF3459 domain-containing protein [Methylobacteriaceae bacterium]
RVAAMLLLTLRGTPTMYYGDEIGLGKVEIPADRVQDPWEKNEPGLGFGRDPERTPMQWDATAGAGFSTVEPWLPLAPGHQDTNVATLSGDPRSILSLYRALIRLRGATPALAIGDYEPVELEGALFAFRRTYGGDTVEVVLNLGSEPVTVQLSDRSEPCEILLSTHLDRTGFEPGPELALRSDEGVIVRKR